MNQRVRALFENAQQLTSAEREELAGLLLATIDVDAEIEAEWAKEIDDRIGAHVRGDMQARPVAPIIAKYRKA